MNDDERYTTDVLQACFDGYPWLFVSFVFERQLDVLGWMYSSYMASKPSFDLVFYLVPCVLNEKY